MTDIRQTPEYARYMQSLGWKVEKLNCEDRIENFVYLRKIPLLGWVTKFQRGTISQSQFDILNSKFKFSAFYLEPLLHTTNSILPGFQPAKSPFLPSKTIHIDLTNSQERLLKEMKPKTRYNIKVAQRNGVEIRESKDIDGFVNMWNKSARNRGSWLSQTKEINALWDAFSPNHKAHLLLAYPPVTYIDICNIEPLAGVLLVYSPDTAFYMYAGSTKEGKKLFAPTLLVWEALKLSKKLGLKTFDFEGIYDERYKSTNNWKGFTKFKEGFGGKTIIHPLTQVYHSNFIARNLL